MEGAGGRWMECAQTSTGGGGEPGRWARVGGSYAGLRNEMEIHHTVRWQRLHGAPPFLSSSWSKVSINTSRYLII